MIRGFLKKALPILLCTTLACGLPASAEGSLPESDPVSVTVYGMVKSVEEGALLLERGIGGSTQPMLVHIGEKTRVLDAVTGLPAAPVQQGDWIYAHVSPQMMLSEPPQAAALVVLTGIPADFGAPMYYQVTAAVLSAGGTQTILRTDRGVTLTVGADCLLEPYLTKNIVTVHDLVPGATLLAWSNGWGSTAEMPEKIMVFPYEYRGWLSVDEKGVMLGGEHLAGAQVQAGADGALMIPLRAVCEALGLTVEWIAEENAAVVSDQNGVVLRHIIGTDKAAQDGLETTLSCSSFERGGRTFMAPADLAALLNLALES